MDINHLISLSNIAKEQGRQSPKRRELHQEISSHKDKTFLAVLGPRGVGKSVLLKQLHSEITDSFYISLDTLERDADLFSLVKSLVEEFKFKQFFLDEIHFNSDCNRHLKNIFDFLSVKIVFTSSVALKLVESAHDLSRRVKVFKLPPFSFREFLLFNNLPCPPEIKFQDLISGKFLSEHIAVLPYFERYIRGGNYPFSLEVTDVLGALRNNLDKIIQSDIPRLQKLTIDELDLIHKTFKFIARSPVSDINPTTISNNIKITRYKATQYLDLLEQAFLVKQIYPIGTNVLKEPKVLLSIPYRLLELDYASSIGGLREDFAIDALSRVGLEAHYLKSTTGKKTPDFMVKVGSSKVIIEVGGSGKTHRQFKGIDPKIKKVIFADGSNISTGAIPLPLLGLLQSN